MKRRLAQSQARGERQMGSVNELLAGPVAMHEVTYPRPAGEWPRLGVTWVYGHTRTQHKSFMALRRRLYDVGFIFITDRERRTVKMAFPELEDN